MPGGGADPAWLGAEFERILPAAEAAGVTLRLMGSLAVWMRSPGARGTMAAQRDPYADIDVVGYGRQAKEVGALFESLGYVPDREVFIVSEGRRAIYELPQAGLHIDVFYDQLDFCHVIKLQGRLEVDYPTIPLAELLLSKLQIVKINEKDLLDVLLMLREHSLEGGDREGIDAGRVALLCAEDWGLWRTATFNVEKARQTAASAPALDQADRTHLLAQLKLLSDRIEAEPKSMAWRMRARVGERRKWYNDVDEVR